MTKLSKEDFYKKFIKKQDILEATTDNPIILGVVPDPDEVWAYCEAYAKQQREEIIKMLKFDIGKINEADLIVKQEEAKRI